MLMLFGKCTEYVDCFCIVLSVCVCVWLTVVLYCGVAGNTLHMNTLFVILCDCVCVCVFVCVSVHVCI